MEKKSQSQKDLKNKSGRSQGTSGLNDYLKYAGMGAQMLALILIFAWIGKKIDERTASEKPVFTAILALLGVFVGLYSSLKDFMKNDNNS